jgi:hypothetical protein
MMTHRPHSPAAIAGEQVPRGSKVPLRRRHADQIQARARQIVEPGMRWTKPSIVVMNEANYSGAHSFPTTCRHETLRDRRHAGSRHAFVGGKRSRSHLRAACLPVSRVKMRPPPSVSQSRDGTIACDGAVIQLFCCTDVPRTVRPRWMGAGSALHHTTRGRSPSQGVRRSGAEGCAPHCGCRDRWRALSGADCERPPRRHRDRSRRAAKDHVCVVRQRGSGPPPQRPTSP